MVKDPPPPVNLSGTPVERVTAFKLLGVHVASDLKWSQHIDTITSQAASRLHFLKQLKRPAVGYDDLLYLYVTVIRTVLDSTVLCGTPVSPPHSRRHWSRCSSERCGSFSNDYTMSLKTLESRRDQLTERFFQRSFLPETSCLHCLLPDKGDPSVTDRRHHPKKL